MTTRAEGRPRLGFLGVGWIGRHRLQAIAEAGIAEIVALAEPDATCLAAARGVAPAAAVVDGLDGLLRHDLDGIVIATPSALHAEQSIAALGHGRAVFCQKPLGRSAAENARVVEAARRSDRLLGVDFSYRFTEGVQRMATLLRDGAVGDVFAAELVFHNAYGPDKPWFYDPAQSGGGCVTDLGIHLVDLALWLLDWPSVEEVSARLFREGRPVTRPAAECEDYAEARLTLSDGAVVRLTSSWRLHAGCDAIIEARFSGTKGGLALRNVNGSFYDFTAELHRGTSREVLASPPDAWGGRAAVDWARRLAGGARFDAEIGHVVDVARTLDRIRGT